MADSPNVTQLLKEFQSGNDTAADRLWSEVYGELRGVAHQRLSDEGEDHSLDTTALVHECYLKLVDQSEVQWESRLHFYAMASRVMRNILIDYARRQAAKKRGGDAAHVPVHDVSVGGKQRSADLFITLDQALDELEELDERLVRVVEYRFFGGMEEKEIAELMDLSPRTIRRDWRKAKGWLSRILAEDL